MKQPNALPRQAADPDQADWLSALYDGEAEVPLERDTLRAILADAGVRRGWREYSLIGDALRQDLNDPARSTRVMEKFAAALAAEPTVLAPRLAARGYSGTGRWLAAVASVAALGWIVYVVLPQGEAPVSEWQFAEGAVSAAEVGFEGLPYLAAHQDYAHAVLSAPEMRFTQVSLKGAGE